MQENEIKEYLKRELDKGQTVEVLTDNVVENTDMLIFIITKHESEQMDKISRLKKIAFVKRYIENYKKYFYTSRK